MRPIFEYEHYSWPLHYPPSGGSGGLGLRLGGMDCGWGAWGQVPVPGTPSYELDQILGLCVRSVLPAILHTLPVLYPGTAMQMKWECQMGKIPMYHACTEWKGVGGVNNMNNTIMTYEVL
eukprot:598024-Rhodomonas_salina.1